MSASSGPLAFDGVVGLGATVVGDGDGAASGVGVARTAPGEGVAGVAGGASVRLTAT